jgi:hypothetical protein
LLGVQGSTLNEIIALSGAKVVVSKRLVILKTKYFSFAEFY